MEGRNYFFFGIGYSKTSSMMYVRFHPLCPYDIYMHKKGDLWQEYVPDWPNIESQQKNWPIISNFFHYIWLHWITLHLNFVSGCTAYFFAVVVVVAVIAINHICITEKTAFINGYIYHWIKCHCAWAKVKWEGGKEREREKKRNKHTTNDCIYLKKEQDAVSVIVVETLLPIVCAIVKIQMESVRFISALYDMHLCVVLCNV